MADQFFNMINTIYSMQCHGHVQYNSEDAFLTSVV